MPFTRTMLDTFPASINDSHYTKINSQSNFHKENIEYIRKSYEVSIYFKYKQ